MITTLDIIDILYTALNVGDVQAAISGVVCKAKRPINSTKVDICINCLPTNNLQIQTAVPNVNIHVPNLVLTENNLTDTTQPDFAKLRTVTALVISKLKDQYFGDYWFDVQQQHVFAEDDIKEHYSNIRLNFYSINI